MTDTTIARPYAQAAFEYAKAHHAVREWQEALSTWSILAKNAEIKQVTLSPLVSADTREDLLASFVKAKPGQPLRNFLNVVLEHHRFFVMPSILDQFVALHNASDDTVPVSVTSSIALSEAEKSKITQKLKAKINQKIILSCAIDPTLLGGVVIRYGDQVIDASLKYRLSTLEDCLN